MKVNLHTHTTRCYHAMGADEEYVQAAIAAGYTKLGFSDHTPFPYNNGFFNGDKMEIGELEGYVSSILALKEKYRDRIQILLGMECEAVERFFPFLAQQRQRMDYLILGNHGDKTIEPFFGRLTRAKELWHYVETAARGMETGLYLYLAHPDLMLNSYPAFDDEARRASRALCREANRMGLPMEYNLLGLIRGAQPGTLGYPCRGFWEIAAEENVQAVIGVDAHSPAQLLSAPYERAARELAELGIPLIEDPTAL